MKPVPDDVVLVVIGIFSAIVYMWFNLESVKSIWDFQLMMVTCSGLIGVPMVYSMYCGYKLKKEAIIKLLSWGVTIG